MSLACQATHQTTSNIRPRGVSRLTAAFYVEVDPNSFDEMVRDGRMPAPKVVDTKLVWDTFALDAAFDDFPTQRADNPWDANYG